jgi:hypothetical protein
MEISEFDYLFILNALHSLYPKSETENGKKVKRKNNKSPLQHRRQFNPCIFNLNNLAICDELNCLLKIVRNGFDAILYHLPKRIVFLRTHQPCLLNFHESHVLNTMMIQRDMSEFGGKLCSCPNYITFFLP